MNFSPLELIVVAVLVILLFGVKRLPELGSGLGQAISNFKKSFRESSSDSKFPDNKSSLDSSKSIEDKKI